MAKILNLTFREPNLESTFLREHRREAAGAVRLVCAVAATAVALFGFVDLVDAGGFDPKAWIRYGFLVPILAALAMLSRSRTVRCRIDAVAGVVFGSVLVAEALLLLWANPDQVLVYQMGLLVMVVGGYVGIRVRWTAATLGGLSGSLVAVGLLLTVMDPGWQRQASLLLLAVANALGIIVAWNHERSQRARFLDAQRIRRQSLELADLINRLQDQALTDTLTGLFNRRALELRLDQEIGQVRRNRSTSSVVVLDLDGFKKLNDELGHAAGDELLRRVGELLRSNLRASDVAFRLGGDELCILLPGRSVAEARLVAERLRVQVELEGLTMDAHVSFSAGCTKVRPDDSSHAVVLERADALLYLAKASGKGRVEAESSAPDQEALPRVEVRWVPPPLDLPIPRAPGELVSR